MTSVTANLHSAFLRPFGTTVIRHSDIRVKPLLVDLALPLPPRLRVYMYSLVGGDSKQRNNEYKAVLRVPGQEKGAYASFDYSQGRVAILAAYLSELDVFVLWDASIHPRFKYGGNIQVRGSTVLQAAAIGRSEQRRSLPSGITEVVLACQSWNLVKAINERVALTGGMIEGKWARSRN